MTPESTSPANLREAIITVHISKYAYAARKKDEAAKKEFIAGMKQYGIEVKEADIKVFHPKNGAKDKASAFSADATEDGKKIRIFGFPGTETKFDVKVDADARYQDVIPLPGEPDIRIAHGFKDRYVETKDLPEFDKQWLSSASKADFMKLSAVRIGGHSLGGAIASIHGAALAWHLSKETGTAPKIKMGTIGQPRVFAKQNADLLQAVFTKNKKKNPRKNKFFRIVNSQDPVPSLPLATMKDIPSAFTGGWFVRKDKLFKHFGEAFLLIKQNKKWCMAPQEPQDFSKFRLAPNPFVDGHMADSYLRRLKIIECQNTKGCDPTKLRATEDELAEDWYEAAGKYDPDVDFLMVAADSKQEDVLPAEGTNPWSFGLLFLALMTPIVAAFLAWKWYCRKGDILQVDFEEGREGLVPPME